MFICSHVNGVRRVIGKCPPMNISNYDSDVWLLHRKLFHRYVKYHECFDRVTEAIPSYNELVDDPASVMKKKEKPKSVPLKLDIVTLLSSSSDEEEYDSDASWAIKYVRKLL